MEGKYDVIVAGNICLDIVMGFSKRHSLIQNPFTPGNNIVVDPTQLVTGGSVANTGIALHRLGQHVALVARVGEDDFGKAIINKIEDIKKDLTKNIIRVREGHTSHTFVISIPGKDRIFVHHQGVNDTFTLSDIDSTLILNACLFHFGYPPSMKTMYSNNGDEMKKIFATAKNKGAITSLDMALPDPASDAGKIDWLAWLGNVLPNVDIFTPSLEELLFMMERDKYEDISKNAGRESVERRLMPADILRLTGKLLDMGAAIVLLKLGENGVCVRSTDSDSRMERVSKLLKTEANLLKGKCILSPCFDVNVVGTTGAGDCTIAGFLSALLRGYGLDEAAVFAVACGSYCVEHHDGTTGIPDWSSVETRVKTGRRKGISLDTAGWEYDKNSQIWRIILQ